MSVGMIIFAAFLGLLVAASLAIALLSFRRKMRILTNPYMWMSEAERESEFAKIGADGVNWLFRQQGTVGVLCALLALFLLLDIAVPADFPFMLGMWITLAVAMVYVIASSVKVKKLTDVKDLSSK